MLSADRTSVIIENSIMAENCSTPGCWAPWSIFLVLLYKHIEAKFVVFLFQFSIYKLLHINYWHISTTTRWTWDVYFFIFYQCFNVITHTGSMENMTAWKRSYIRKLNILFTDLAFNFHIWILYLWSKLLIIPYFFLLKKLQKSNLTVLLSFLLCFYIL